MAETKSSITCKYNRKGKNHHICIYGWKEKNPSYMTNDK